MIALILYDAEAAVGFADPFGYTQALIVKLDPKLIPTNGI